MARRYLGYGITNNQGVAKLKYLYDPSTGQTSQTASDHSYTGVGAGKLDIVAESGSLQSETYEILDCIKYDTGIDGTATNIYDNTSASAMTRTSEYTSLKEVTIGTEVGTSISSLGTSFAVDFEYYQVDGSSGSGFLSLFDSSTYKEYFSISMINENIETWLNLRLTVDEGQATLTNLDNPSRTYAKTFTGTANRIRFSTGSSCTEIRFRNVRCYPI